MLLEDDILSGYDIIYDRVCSPLTILVHYMFFFFFSSRRRHTRCSRDWSSDVCSSDLFGCAPALPTLIQSRTGMIGFLASALSGLSARPGRRPSSHPPSAPMFSALKIGRASCRERV